MIHHDIRQRLEEREERLSPLAAKSQLSRGREHTEEPSLVRTAFQRDRDRIIHSKAFRRLKHKSQVFIAPLGDHYVTRLTHTLEVAQIARTISRALSLNEDLTEAIALGHDLGHTPFGHAGEEALALLSPDGFRHNEQSLRVVDVLERDGMGLNLTWEVRNGILKHSKVREDIMAEAWGQPETLEGQVCRLADSVAYINHDIEDAIRAGLIRNDDLPSSATSVLGCSHSERINTLVCDIIDCSWAATGEGQDYHQQPIITMGRHVQEAANLLREFLFTYVYTSSAVMRETEKAKGLVKALYNYFLLHLEELPEEFRLHDEQSHRQVVDYIAGMTDSFALRLVWQLPFSSEVRQLTHFTAYV